MCERCELIRVGNQQVSFPFMSGVSVTSFATFDPIAHEKWHIPNFRLSYCGISILTRQLTHPFVITCLHNECLYHFFPNHQTTDLNQHEMVCHNRIHEYERLKQILITYDQEFKYAPKNIQSIKCQVDNCPCQHVSYDFTLLQQRRITETDKLYLVEIHINWETITYATLKRSPFKTLFEQYLINHRKQIIITLTKGLIDGNSALSLLDPYLFRIISQYFLGID